MSESAKEIVEYAYNSIAGWYFQWVEGQVSPRERYISKMLENMQANPHVLDLGCGPGVPTTRMLLERGASVLANDIAAEQLGIARIQCPQASFLQGDMASLSFAPEIFDGIVSFYALFHLPREEQRTLLSKIHSWLKSGGYFVFNLATIDEEEIHGEFLGRGIFWSSYDTKANEAMVEQAGFRLVEVEVLEAGDGQLDEDDPDYDMEFLWILAKKEQ